MLGLVVRAVHLPLAGASGRYPPAASPTPGAGWSLRRRCRRCGERPAPCPGSGSALAPPPPGAQSLGASSPRPSLSPAPASSPGASRDPRMGRGRGRVPLETEEVLHPAIPQPRPKPKSWGPWWRFQNFYVGFRGRHLVGRGLQCLSCSRFVKNWTLDCLHAKGNKCSGMEKGRRKGFLLGPFHPPK